MSRRWRDPGDVEGLTAAAVEEKLRLPESRTGLTAGEKWRMRILVWVATVCAVMAVGGWWIAAAVGEPNEAVAAQAAARVDIDDLRLLIAAEVRVPLDAVGDATLETLLIELYTAILDGISGGDASALQSLEALEGLDVGIGPTFGTEGAEALRDASEAILSIQELQPSVAATAVASVLALFLIAIRRSAEAPGWAARALGGRWFVIGALLWAATSVGVGFFAPESVRSVQDLGAVLAVTAAQQGSWMYAAFSGLGAAIGVGGWLAGRH